MEAGNESTLLDVAGEPCICFSRKSVRGTPSREQLQRMRKANRRLQRFPIGLVAYKITIQQKEYRSFSQKVRRAWKMPAQNERCIARSAWKVACRVAKTRRDRARQFQQNPRRVSSSAIRVVKRKYAHGEPATAARLPQHPAWRLDRDASWPSSEGPRS